MLGPEGTPPLLKGSCFCGSIDFSIYGLPQLSAYCHCTHCQRLSGCPFVHMMNFKELDFIWTTPLGQRAMHTFDYYEAPLRPHNRRFWCQKCGTPMGTFNTRTGQYSVFGANLERGPDGEILGWERVKPTAHQFYGTRMLDMNDNLEKWEGYEGKSKRMG